MATENPDSKVSSISNLFGRQKFGILYPNMQNKRMIFLAYHVRCGILIPFFFVILKCRNFCTIFSEFSCSNFEILKLREKKLNQNSQRKFFVKIIHFFRPWG